jgi:hypothetical protein
MITDTDVLRLAEVWPYSPRCLRTVADYIEMKFDTYSSKQLAILERLLRRADENGQDIRAFLGI